ncbi:MAG: penicillin acylase family protein [Desulfobacteraceae bacterium]|nr:penicillin acylase family protein [Desulfobacteraceae bacterium]
MKKIRIAAAAAAVIVIALIVFIFVIINSNTYITEGEVKITQLKKNARILRDGKGMAYIYAQNLHDALFAMGFATAQDRLFQMEISRLVSRGRISEMLGEKGIQTDKKMRTLSFYKNAEKHSQILSSRTKQFFQWYIDGVNEFIINHKDDHHMKFNLAGIEPEPWEIEDSLCLLYYMGWNSAGDINTEIIAQMLVEKLGAKKAGEIFPVNTHPGEKHAALPTGEKYNMKQAGIDWRQVLHDQKLQSIMEADSGFRVGSNNWAVSAARSRSGKPVVANDTHLDARIMPGPWYPCALIMPEERIAGASIPGIPAIIAGRNTNVAVGITNSYGDAQDLYIETIDPDNPEHYMEGSRSIPFKVRTETIRIKDKDAPGKTREQKIRIRSTKRGPVVSGVLKGLDTKHVITMRWSPFDSMTPSLGIRDLMFAESTAQVKKALSSVTTIMLNFVFADIHGNIGWQTTGRIPVRTHGESIAPLKVENETDNWSEWIPYPAMPQEYNPAEQWLGTCNHKTVPEDYPYYISSQFSPSYRYRRLGELMGEGRKLSVDDHWAFQRDIKNLMAKKIAPVMAESLAGHDDTKEMSGILSDWDYKETRDSLATALFHAVYREFLYQTFEDELGKELLDTFADKGYFWKERLEQMVLSGGSSWFDDIATEKRETMEDIFHRAAVSAKSGLEKQFGEDPEKWQWGRLHKLEFINPVARDGFLKDILGGGTHPMGGSAETLYRAMYSYTDPFDVTLSASLRMVADLGDPDKVAAVIPCGIAGRLFHDHAKDQTDAFMNGDKLYWWFSDKMIKDHTRQQLVLNAGK